MKKILTVSLFAVMAVSAAHAKIASVEYVEGASVLGLTEGQTVQTELKNAVVPAVKALQTKVDQISEGTGLTLGTDAVNTGNIVDGAVALVDLNKEVTDAIADAKKAGTDASTALANHVTTANNTFETKQDASDKLTAAKDYTDLAAKKGTDGKLGSGFVKDYVDEQLGSVNNLVGEASTTLQQLVTVDEGGQATGPGEFLLQYVEGTVGGLKVDKVTAADGQYFNAYAEANGKISMEQKAFETTIVADEMNAPTTAAVYDAIESAKGGIDSTHAAEANKFVTGMTQEDGVITQVTTSTINDAVIALGQVPTECGTNGTNKCALSVKNGTFYWEIIEE